MNNNNKANMSAFALKLLKNIPLLLFILVFVVFGLITPVFFEWDNIENILTSSSYIGIVAIGMTLVLLTGGIDLSVGSLMFLSASSAGLLIRNFGFPIWLAIVSAIVIGLLVGAFHAFCINKLKLVPFIVTLSTLVALKGLTLMLTKSVAVEWPSAITGMASRRLLGFIPLPVFIFIVIIILVQLMLKSTPLGRHIYAVGYNSEVAAKAGIDHIKIIAVVYILCSVLAAIGGIISVTQLGIVNAGYGEGEEFKAIAAAVLGGTSLSGGVGSVFPGVVIGTLLIQVVQAGLVYLQVDIYMQPIITAGIILLAILLDSLRTMLEKRLERRNITKSCE